MTQIMTPDRIHDTSQFFANRKPKTASKVAYDTNLTARLWQISANLVGLDKTSVLVLPAT